MSSSFVTLGKNAEGKTDKRFAVGFWMHDQVLEIWLRILALHIEDPESSNPEHSALVRAIRDQWLLASRGYFMGCVPHGLEQFSATELGTQIIKRAVKSAMAALSKASGSVPKCLLNLLGFAQERLHDLEVKRLQAVGSAFCDLLDGRILKTAADTDYIMPGS